MKISMLGVPGRNGLWGCVALCVLLAVGGVYLSLANAQYWLVTVLALAAAIPYWLTIRWVDRYGSWDGDHAR